MLTLVVEVTLHDDVAEKLTMMSKWEAVLDDERNPHAEDWDQRISDYMREGKSYRVTLVVEEINDSNHRGNSETDNHSTVAIGSTS